MNLNTLQITQNVIKKLKRIIPDSSSAVLSGYLLEKVVMLVWCSSNIIVNFKHNFA